MNPETLIREAVVWIQKNNYKIDRLAWYGNYYCPIRAVIKMNNKPDSSPSFGVEIAARLLNVSDEWVRAFMYGFAGCMPQLKNQDGVKLARPLEAFKLGWDMGVEFCGDCPRPWEQLDIAGR